MTAELLTPKEVAARLRVTVRTVRRWIRSGALPAVKIRNTIRVPATAIEPRRSR
jgi:excisionase family DNA binding protein